MGYSLKSPGPILITDNDHEAYGCDSHRYSADNIRGILHPTIAGADGNPDQYTTAPFSYPCSAFALASAPIDRHT